jgi:phosphoribosylformimino-5-aminoimidazole carboxamide ribotide isomerase
MKFYNIDLFEYLEILRKDRFKRIHIVDLYGAEKGNVYEMESLKQIKENFSFKVQFGGGVRSFNVFNKLLNLCDFVIIGTKAFDKQFIESIERYKKRVIIALDIYKRKVFVKGWKQNSGVGFLDALDFFAEKGFKNFLITDIKRDGTMRGIDKRFSLFLKNKVRHKKINFYYAGGIKDDHDIDYLRKSGIFKGAVCGKYMLERILKCLPEEL